MSVPWMDFYSPNPALLAYQDHRDIIKVLDVTNIEAPGSMASFTHESDILTARWITYANMPSLIIGDLSGNVFVYSLHQEKRVKVIKKKFGGILTAARKGDYEPDMIASDLRVDPSNENYIIVGFSNGSIIAYDLMGENIINSYHRVPGKIGALEWIPGIPGGFISADTRTSSLKMWSVSQEASLESVKLLTSTVHSVSRIAPVNFNRDNKSATVRNTLFISFDDGSVGLFDLVKQVWLYLRHGGHTETIFFADAHKAANLSKLINHDELKPNQIPHFDTVKHDFDTSEALIVASASYDGSVKLWDIGQSTYRGIPLQDGSNNSKGATLTNHRKSSLNGFPIRQNVGLFSNPTVDFTFLDCYPPYGAGRKRDDMAMMETKDGIWYSVSWSGDGSLRWVAGSSRGHCVVYDSKNARIIGEYNYLHTDAVYRCSWNPHTDKSICSTANLVATCSADGFLILWKPEDGSVVKRYKTDAELFGCAWSPLYPGLIAAGSVDGRIHIWNTCETRDTPRNTLYGHTGKVFHNCWSPLIPNYLATASDDCDIRIWDVDTQQCLKVLRGHRKKARAIEWHPEISKMILTGSWDCDIRFWNIETAECVHVITGHAADIYSFVSFNNYPFVFLSTSRDNTIRLWKQEGPITQIRGKLFSEVVKGNISGAVSLLSGPLSPSESKYKGCTLEGPFTQRTISILKSDSSYIDKLSAVIRLFSSLDGDEAFRRAILFLQKNYKAKYTYHDGFSSILPPNKVIKNQEKLQALQLSCQPLSTLSEDRSLSQFSASTKVELLSLLDAAKARLQFNDIQGYCDSLSLLGHWDRALALAPVVSLEYWKDLLNRHNDFIKSTVTQSPDLSRKVVVDVVLPYYLANQDWKAAIDLLLTINEFQEAYLLAAAVEEMLMAASTMTLNCVIIKTPDIDKGPKLLPPLLALNGQKNSGSQITKTGSYLDQVISAMIAHNQKKQDKVFAAKVNASWSITLGNFEGAQKILRDTGLNEEAEILNVIKPAL